MRWVFGYEYIGKYIGFFMFERVGFMFLVYFLIECFFWVFNIKRILVERWRSEINFVFLRDKSGIIVGVYLKWEISVREFGGEDWIGCFFFLCFWLIREFYFFYRKKVDNKNFIWN